MKRASEPPFMGEVGARDLCNNYFIAFADLHFQITNPAME
jgi:hypothetical protein